MTSGDHRTYFNIGVYPTLKNRTTPGKLICPQIIIICWDPDKYQLKTILKFKFQNKATKIVTIYSKIISNSYNPTKLYVLNFTDNPKQH